MGFNRLFINCTIILLHIIHVALTNRTPKCLFVIIISLFILLLLLLLLLLSLSLLFSLFSFLINTVVALYNNGIFFTVCKHLNGTAGTMSSCKIDCCEGDLCNTDNTAVRISSFVTSFVVVLLTLFQNLFPGA